MISAPQNKTTKNNMQIYTNLQFQMFLQDIRHYFLLHKLPLQVAYQNHSLEASCLPDSILFHISTCGIWL